MLSQRGFSHPEGGDGVPRSPHPHGDWPRRAAPVPVRPRDGATRWSVPFEFHPVAQNPFAVAGDTIVVAAWSPFYFHHRRHLRVVGIDAASGARRYVRRYAVDPGIDGDVVAAGSLVLVWGTELLALRPASGDVVWVAR
jgi:hypothetical protein